MISRRTGPISPARTGTEPDEADDTVAGWFDAFGLGSSHTTFTIGITPACGCQHERASRRSAGQDPTEPTPTLRLVHVPRRGAQFLRNGDTGGWG
jgi:hypothetical protein